MLAFSLTAVGLCIFSLASRHFSKLTTDIWEHMVEVRQLASLVCIALRHHVLSCRLSCLIACLVLSVYCLVSYLVLYIILSCLIFLSHLICILSCILYRILSCTLSLSCFVLSTLRCGTMSCLVSYLVLHSVLSFIFLSHLICILSCLAQCLVLSSCLILSISCLVSCLILYSVLYYLLVSSYLYLVLYRILSCTLSCLALVWSCHVLSSLFDERMTWVCFWRRTMCTCVLFLLRFDCSLAPLGGIKVSCCVSRESHGKRFFFCWVDSYSLVVIRVFVANGGDASACTLGFGYRSNPGPLCLSCVSPAAGDAFQLVRRPADPVDPTPLVRYLVGGERQHEP